jgi:hypothetical protein
MHLPLNRCRYMMKNYRLHYSGYSDNWDVTSGMDPHIISGTWDLVWLSLGLGFIEVGFFRLWVDHGEIL